MKSFILVVGQTIFQLKERK